MLLATPAFSAQPKTTPQSPKAWVQSVCLAIGTWAGAEDAVLAEAVRAVPAAPTPTDARTSVAATLGTLADRTDELVIVLQRGGRPTVADGKAAADGMVSRFQSVAKELRSSRDRVSKAATDDTTAFTTSLEKEATSLESALEKVTLGKSWPGGATIARAAAREKACASVAQA